MQINIQKHHFYTLAGLFLFLILILIFIPIDNKDMITGADTQEMVADRLSTYQTPANFITRAVAGGADDPTAFGHKASEIYLSDGTTTVEEALTNGGTTSAGGWPAGNYCILASALDKDCPNGFLATPKAEISGNPPSIGQGGIIQNYAIYSGNCQADPLSQIELSSLPSRAYFKADTNECTNAYLMFCCK